MDFEFIRIVCRNGIALLEYNNVKKLGSCIDHTNKYMKLEHFGKIHSILKSDIRLVQGQFGMEWVKKSRPCICKIIIALHLENLDLVDAIMRLNSEFGW